MRCPFFWSLSFFSVMEPLLLGRRMGSPLLRHHHIDLPTFIFFSFLLSALRLLFYPCSACWCLSCNTLDAPHERSRSAGTVSRFIYKQFFLLSFSLFYYGVWYMLNIYFFISFGPWDRRNIGSIVAIIVRPTTYHQRTNQEPFLFDFHGKYWFSFYMRSRVWKRWVNAYIEQYCNIKGNCHILFILLLSKLLCLIFNPLFQIIGLTWISFSLRRTQLNHNKWWSVET